MKNVRDGGRIIDCKFSEQKTKEIIEKLTGAKIKIIEAGFRRDWYKVKYQGNSMFFTNNSRIKPLIDRENKNTQYTAQINRFGGGMTMTTLNGEHRICHR